MPWDTKVLGLRVGIVSDTVCLPSRQEMNTYDLVIAKLPIEWDAGHHHYQNIGFKFVAQDFSMSCSSDITAIEKRVMSDVTWISREVPPFSINGFHIEDSRLMRDLHCRSRIDKKFWDKVITEHCNSYADRVACVVSPNDQRLVGFVSCFNRNGFIELSLIAVHPDYQSHGIGSKLLQFLKLTSAHEGCSLKTEVLTSNIKAINFYTHHGFKIESAVNVMHRWTKQ